MLTYIVIPISRHNSNLTREYKLLSLISVKVDDAGPNGMLIRAVERIEMTNVFCHR
jgi:hypothetical protein